LRLIFLILVNLISTCTTMSNSDTRNAAIAAAHRQMAKNTAADATTTQPVTPVPPPPPALDPCAQPLVETPNFTIDVRL
jgi:hypothetical protein